MVLGLFTLPKIYEMRKDEIDSAVGTGREALQKQYNTAQAKVGAAAAACILCCVPGLQAQPCGVLECGTWAVQLGWQAHMTASKCGELRQTASRGARSYSSTMAMSAGKACRDDHQMWGRGLHGACVCMSMVAHTHLVYTCSGTGAGCCLHSSCCMVEC